MSLLNLHQIWNNNNGRWNHPSPRLETQQRIERTQEIRNAEYNNELGHYFSDRPSTNGYPKMFNSGTNFLHEFQSHQVLRNRDWDTPALKRTHTWRTQTQIFWLQKKWAKFQIMGVIKSGCEPTSVNLIGISGETRPPSWDVELRSTDNGNGKFPNRFLM